MQWFKFFGPEFLIDPKMTSLTAAERSCWLSLLCYACAAEHGGIIEHVSEEHLMRNSGLYEMDDEWQRTTGVLDKFVKLDMITLDNGVITLSNWSKRQGNALSGYERLKRWREKQKGDNNDNVIRPFHDNGKRERERDRKKEDSKESGNGENAMRRIGDFVKTLPPAKKKV